MKLQIVLCSLFHILFVSRHAQGQMPDCGLKNPKKMCKAKKNSNCPECSINMDESFDMNDVIEVSWNDYGAEEYDWITISEPDGPTINWLYTCGSQDWRGCVAPKTGSIEFNFEFVNHTMPLHPGDYEACLWHYIEEDDSLVTCKSFEVEEPFKKKVIKRMTVKPLKKKFKQGQPIGVKYDTKKAPAIYNMWAGLMPWEAEGSEQDYDEVIYWVTASCDNQLPCTELKEKGQFTLQESTHLDEINMWPPAKGDYKVCFSYNWHQPWNVLVKCSKKFSIV